MIARLTAAAALTLALAVPALADDAADCSAGIEFIKAEIAKNPSDAKVAAALKEALSDAEREANEKEFDECLEAVQEAKDAVGAG